MQCIYRLKSYGAFHYIYKKGERVKGKNLVLYFAKSNKGLKAGFSVSKHVGNSVTRNRVKRHLRENFRLLLNDIDHGYSFVVVAGEKTADMNHYQIGDELKFVLKKANLIK